MNNILSKSRLGNSITFDAFKIFKLYNIDKTKFNYLSENMSYIIYIEDVKTLNWNWKNRDLTDNSHYYFKNELPKGIELKLYSDKMFWNYNKNIINKFHKMNDKSSICRYYMKFEFDKITHWYFNSKILIDDDKYFNITINIDNLLVGSSKIKNILNYTFSDCESWEKFKLLSKREKEIMKKLAAGNSNQEIGFNYGIKESTIRKHRENIYKKLNIKNILELEKFCSAFELIGAV